MFSKPVCDRAVYKTIKKNRVTSIVEIGIGDGTRATNCIRLAHKYAASPDSIRYTGVDLFEGRTDGPHIPLRTAHKQFNQLGARVRLVPGDLSCSIPTIANAHVRTDLIIISGDYRDEDLESTWFYLPRMLHAGSTVLIQKAGQQESAFSAYSRLDVERLANESRTRREKAAA